MTQSLATTGVSTMTAPLIGSAGTVGAPGYTFNGANKTGFYLAGANQIGWSANGVQGATLNSDLTTTWAGSMTVTGTMSATKGTVPIGTVADFAGSAAPAGWLLCFGQLVSTTTYAALFAILSTTYGSGGGTFGIPDYRGRTAYGQDNMGGSAANRITVAGGNFDGTVLGGTGGGQNHSLTLGEAPTGITSTGTITGTATTGNGTFNTFIISQNANTFGAAGGGGISAPQQPVYTASVPVTGTASVTSTNTSGTAHTILNPAIITNKIIFAGV